MPREAMLKMALEIAEAANRKIAMDNELRRKLREGEPRTSEPKEVEEKREPVTAE